MTDFVPYPADLKPLSTYPEDREKLLALAREIDNGALLDDDDFRSKACTLADWVKAILEDEAAGMEPLPKS